MYALALKRKTSLDLLTAFSSSLTSQSFNPRGIDTHFTVVLLDTIRYTCRDLGFTKTPHHDDTNLGFPYSTSSSSEEDDVLENDPGFWDYDDLNDWGAAEPDASSEASCASHPPPNH
ncbi:hypothetical protein PIB30_102724 [Stylosanthes scabra]|uniref:Uncharacterized protein n=1 Tax=Stylosanthes scabra TaxID=79078 RepID=A0ABU6TXE5_9FABA|nr:hypothetical protein [Stylosanthes scabra]